MKRTMLDYIHKQKDTNLHIFHNRNSLLEPILEKVKDQSFNRIVILATGSSSNAAECAKYFMSDLLDMEITIKMPFIVSNYDQHIDNNALYFAISQSGQSYSTIEAVKEIQNKSNLPVFTFTSDLNSQIAKVSNCPIDIGCGKETVGFVTMGFSATVLILLLTGLELALQKNKIDKSTYGDLNQKILDVIHYTDTVIERSNQWFDLNKEQLANGKKFSVIGYGSGFGVAKEAETKLTETIRRPVIGYELEEYMHGPYLALDDESYVIFIEHNGLLEERAGKLKNYLADYTSNIFTICLNSDEPKEETLQLHFDVDENLAVLLTVIPIQILAYKLAGYIGIDLNVKVFTDFDEKLKSKV